MYFCYSESMKSPFEIIPGIGKSLAGDLESLGFEKIDDLKGQEPQAMYERLELNVGSHVDRCVLYTFRCAVYYADGGRESEKLKWWNWKDN
jgi:hypothetical protein